MFATSISLVFVPVKGPLLWKVYKPCAKAEPDQVNRGNRAGSKSPWLLRGSYVGSGLAYSPKPPAVWEKRRQDQADPL